LAIGSSRSTVPSAMSVGAEIVTVFWPAGSRIGGGRRLVLVLRRGLAGGEKISHHLSRVTAGERLDRGPRGPVRPAGARECGAQHEAADLGRVQDGQRLGDGAAHRPAQHVRPAQAESTNERAGLAGHGVDGERRRQRPGAAYPGVVEDHHPVVAG
jgi:hypothetical protein